MTTIDDLNIDCMMKIFSYFSYPELLILEKVSGKWRTITEYCWKKIRILDSDEPRLTSEGDVRVFTKTLVKILKRSGRYLTQVRIKTYPYWNIIKSNIQRSVAKTCPNIQVLKLSGVLATGEGVLALSKGCTQLKVIEFEHMSNIRDDDMLHMLESNKRLERLLIRWGNLLTGWCLRGCSRNLKELILINCEVIMPQHLYDVCPRFPKLVTLVLENCIPFTGRFISDIAGFFPNLSKFALNVYNPTMHPNSLSPIMQMTNLKFLSLSANTLLSDSVLIEISEKCVYIETLNLSRMHVTNRNFTLAGIASLTKLPNLKKLLLNYVKFITDESLIPLAKKGLLCHLELKTCQYISDEITKQFIRNCPKLQYLDVSECKGVSIETLQLAQQVYKTYADKPKNFLVIVVGGSSIAEENDFQLSCYAHPRIFINFENLCEPTYSHFVIFEESFHHTAEDESKYAQNTALYNKLVYGNTPGINI